MLHLFAANNKLHAVSIQEMRIKSMCTSENFSLVSFILIMFRLTPNLQSVGRKMVSYPSCVNFGGPLKAEVCLD